VVDACFTVGPICNCGLPCSSTTCAEHTFLHESQSHHTTHLSTCNPRCRYGFPKPFIGATQPAEDGYPQYRRRAPDMSPQGHTAIKNNHTYTNQNVVPYNPYLLLRFQCHINVEARKLSTRPLFFFFQLQILHYSLLVHTSTIDCYNCFVTTLALNAPFCAGTPHVTVLLKHTGVRQHP
jgi:hypothetical protein